MGVGIVGTSSENNQEANKMGKHFKQFCDNIPKNRDGYVPDILDMSENDKDAAVVATLKDHSQTELAIAHPSLSEYDKNDCYSALEVVMQDAIDSYNDGIDAMAELELLIPLSEDEKLFLDEPYTAEAYGHKPEDFC